MHIWLFRSPVGVRRCSIDFQRFLLCRMVDGEAFLRDVEHSWNEKIEVFARDWNGTSYHWLFRCNRDAWKGIQTWMGCPFIGDMELSSIHRLALHRMHKYCSFHC